MAKLDLDWLVLFNALYETGSVSQAAERLGIGQGSASTILNKLRAQFKDALFTRTSTSMEPTPFARELAPEFRQMLEFLAQARGGPMPFSPGTSDRCFRICISDYSEIVLLPRLLNALCRAAPHVQIETQKIAPDSPRQLQSGELDLAIGFMPDLDAGFYQQTLFGQSFVCLAARDHPRIKAPRLTKAAYFAERHVVVPTTGTGHVMVRRALAQEGVARTVALRLPSFLGLARIVAQTELLGIVPRSLAETFVQQEPVRMLNLPFNVPDYSVKQHWHARFHTDPSNIWLRRLIAQLFLEADDEQPSA
ncbi:LysR family transcriptional regulator [Ramlibacter sp. AN1133]|uniref:LysR family transcriptional regulator n=1 Tax=Ramlibacter sp. AN1133 TaxID=3133429 RepID=UPI0030C028CF